MRNHPNVLFITYNGHGLGHITRMMAVAKRANGRFTPLFLTLSEAFPLLRDHGFVAEYMPSFEKLDMSKEEWQPLLASRLINLLEHTEPRAVVLDLVRPPPVLASIRENSSGIEFIWSRRGMWRGTRNRVSLRLATRAFDSIVEPGDIAAPIDSGLTPQHRDNVTAVAPIVLVGQEEQAERTHARRRLGVPSDDRAVLVNISESEVRKWTTLVARVRDVVRRTAGNEKIHLFAPLHVLHQGAPPTVDGVMMRPTYPVAEHMRAFDAVVATAGYNTFHETVASGLPAVFVARDSDTLDDQQRRAMFAELCGRASFAQTFFDEEFHRAVGKMLAPGEAVISAAVTEELGAFTGAEEFADLLAEKCQTRATEPYRLERTPGITEAELEVLERFPSGNGLPPDAVASAARVIVVALGFDENALGYTVSRVALRQKERANFKPVFLVDNVETEPLRTQGFQFETIMTSKEWDEVGVTEYEKYVQSRASELQSRYRTNKVITLVPGAELDEEVFDG